MILIDKERGVLTQAEELVKNQQYGYKIQNGAKKASHSDVFRVHDYNYLMKVLQMSKKLQLSDSKELLRFGKREIIN